MPIPKEISIGEGRFSVTHGLTLGFRGPADERMRSGVERMLRIWEKRTGFAFSSSPGKETRTGRGATLQTRDADGRNGSVRSGDKSGIPIRAQPPGLMIDCASAGARLPALGDDESYRLDITPHVATLHAITPFGVLRGLATLTQLLTPGDGKWFLPVATIRDEPRFPWRGLMLDVCRHWQPIEVVERTLDGMAAVKLNVLHLHLSEDQGFRVESFKYPLLQEKGSDGKFFTQVQIREIIAYAAERGIRVVPEFDIPGHATSWLAGYPALGSAPVPDAAYAIERKWGIFEPVLDPSNEQVYTFLEGFLGEMAGLFPDLYFHIGGDEVKGHDWDRNPRIQTFMKAHGLADHAALQAYFNRRVEEILAKHGKRLVGWDEILHDDLPKDAVIQSWRGPEALAAAARKGYPGILSNGYYIDLALPAAPHYLNDPIPAGTTLTPAQQKLVLGGEATMWSEWVTSDTIDSRIWPRTAAIAERLWSPREVQDVSDMYRRLAIESRRLSELGLTHESYIDSMLRKLAGDRATTKDLQDLRTIADLVEPVEAYQRGKQQPGATQLTPLDGLVDAARPDSTLSRDFSAQADRAIFAQDAGDLAQLSASLEAWKKAAAALEKNPPSARVEALGSLFERIDAACAIGLEAAALFRKPAEVPKDWQAERLAKLAEAAKPCDACKLPFIPALRRLVAAAGQGRQSGMSPAEWRKHVETLALP